MEIKTITGEKYDTNSLPDKDAELLESLESIDNLRKWAIAENGVYYTFLSSPNSKKFPNGMSSFHIKTSKDMGLLLDSVSGLLHKFSEGRFKLSVVPIE